MSKIKTIVKAIVMIISGIAIVVVGGFMMSAIARLWTGKETKNPKDPKKEN
jgi:uncharacterized protein involved in response to NO